MSADAINRYQRLGDHSYDVATPGIKANFPDVLAALGRSQLARFGETQLRRGKLEDLYRSALHEVDVRIVPSSQVEGSARITCLSLTPARRRDGIRSSHHSPISRSAPACTSGRCTPSPGTPTRLDSWTQGGVRTAARLDGQVCSVPLHLGLDEADVDRICSVIAESLKK